MGRLATEHLHTPSTTYFLRPCLHSRSHKSCPSAIQKYFGSGYYLQATSKTRTGTEYVMLQLSCMLRLYEQERRLGSRPINQALLSICLDMGPLEVSRAIIKPSIHLGGHGITKQEAASIPPTCRVLRWQISRQATSQVLLLGIPMCDNFV